MNLILFFLSGLAVCGLSIIILLPIATNLGLVDRPNDRKKHEGMPALVGGVAIYFSLLCLSAFSEIITSQLLVCAGLVVFLGVWDDRFTISAKYKLLAQTSITLAYILSTETFILSLGTLPGEVELYLGNFGIIASLIAIVGVMNAFNMIDGIDGLAASLGILAIGFLLFAMFFGDRSLNPHTIKLTIFVLGALIAFLFFNLFGVNNKIFLGDAGAMLLGFLLAVWLIEASQSEPISDTFPASVVSWVIALPVFETISLSIRRIQSGKSPFSADRQHLHHVLLDRGFSSFSCLTIIASLAFAFFAFGVAISQFSGILSGIAFLLTFSLYHWASIKYA